MPLDTDFHHQFARALSNPDIDSLPLLDTTAAGDQRRRFDVYRNNRMVSLINALCDSYPATLSLLGEAFFKAAARAYIDRTPPHGPVLAEYGAGFGDFIATLPHADKVPYAQDVATLEWHWLQSYHSADSSVLQLDTLSTIDSQHLMELRLQCHPALFAMQSNWPIGSVWTACTQQPDAVPNHPAIDMRQPQAVVVTRPEWQVLVNIIPQSGYVFLRALQRGMSIGDAAEQALACDDTHDAGTHLTGLLTLGAFSAIAPTGKQPT